MLWLTLGIIITQNYQSVTCELTAIGKESIIKLIFLNHLEDQKLLFYYQGK